MSIRCRSKGRDFDLMPVPMAAIIVGCVICAALGNCDRLQSLLVFGSTRVQQGTIWMLVGSSLLPRQHDLSACRQTRSRAALGWPTEFWVISEGRPIGGFRCDKVRRSRGVACQQTSERIPHASSRACCADGAGLITYSRSSR